MQSIDTLEALHSNALICTALFRHVANCPPHGAYARLAAITFSTLAEQEYRVLVSPSAVLAFLHANWAVDHMRGYAPLYVASDITSVDVEKLSTTTPPERASTDGRFTNR
jgi:hypothetical protein